MRIYSPEIRQGLVRRSDPDTGELRSEEMSSAPVPRTADRAGAAQDLVAALRARQREVDTDRAARQAVDAARDRARDPVAGNKRPDRAVEREHPALPVPAAELLRAPDERLLDLDELAPRPDKEPEKEPDVDKVAEAEPEKEPEPENELENEPEPEKEVGGKGVIEAPRPRSAQEFDRVAPGSGIKVPGPVVAEVAPPVPAGQRFQPGDGPPDDDLQKSAMDLPMAAKSLADRKENKEEVEEVAAKEQKEELEEQEEELEEQEEELEEQDEKSEEQEEDTKEQKQQAGEQAAPEDAREKQQTSPDDSAEPDEVEEPADKDADKASDEPDNAEDVHEMFEEVPDGMQGDTPDMSAGAGGGGLGSRSELDAWKSKADTAAQNLDYPDLGPVETRTKGMNEHAKGTLTSGGQRRKELPKEAQQVIQAKKRDVSELDQVPETLLKDDPTGAAERVKDAAHREGLAKQILPSLRPTPRGYLPNLYGDPITPAVLDQLRKKYLLPADQRPAKYDEITELQKKMAEDPELKGRVAVFAGQEISGADLPPKPEIAPVHQDDVAAILARIITESEGLGKEWIEKARTDAYPSTALVKAFPNLGKDWSPQESQFLLGEMQRVADAAGISKEKLDKAIKDRQDQLAGDKKTAQTQGDKVFADVKDKVTADFEDTQGTIEGLRQEWEDWADARAAKVSGQANWKAIRKRQRDLQKAVRDMANEWIVAYDDMHKERQKKLGLAAAEQQKAYKAAIAKDREADLADAGEDEAKRKAVESDKKYDKWVEAQMEPVKKAIGNHIKANLKTVTAWQDAMRETRNQAVKQLQDWGDRQIGRERGWIDRLLSWIFGWRDEQKGEAEAFAKQRARETTAALGSNLQLLYNIKGQFGETLEADEKKQLEGMGEEQRAVIDTYYGKGGGDAITAVAAGLKIRLRGQRIPKLIAALKKHVLATPTNSTAGLKLVALAKGMGENPEGIAVSCRSGFEHTWGTDEDKIFNALAKVASKEGGMAVRAAYWNRYGEDFDSRLKSELAGGMFDNEEEYHKARAQIDQNKIEVAAADLRIAVQGWGTDEAKINEVLRGLSDEERQKVIAAYQRMYGENLESRLKSELSGYEQDISLALYKGDKEKADAIELKQAQTGFWGPDKEQIEKVYERIRDEEWEKGRKANPPLTSAQIEAAIKKRQQKVGEKYQTEFKTTIDRDMKITFMFQPAVADMVIGLHELDWKAVDAARVEVERRYSFYADDKTINEKVLQAQYDRAFKKRKYDAELDLQKEEQAWMQANPGKKWTAEYRRQRQQSLEEKASKQAQADSTRSMDELRAYYMKTYGGGGAPKQFDEIIKDMTQGYGEDEAVERLKSGGYLPPDREIYYAVEGAGTDEERLKKTLKGRSKAEIQAIREAWEKAHPPPPTFDERILGELSGRERFDVDMMLKHGEPQTPEEALALAKDKLAYEGRTGGIEDSPHGPIKSERYRDLELQVAQLEKDAAEYRDARARFGSPQRDATGVQYEDARMGAYENSWLSALHSFNDMVEIHRQEVDAKADLISGIVAMVVAVVVGAILAPFTAGQSLWLIAGAAALVAAVSSAAAMATKWAIKGEAYGGDELMMDLAFAAVDVVVSAATAGIGGKILKASMQGGKAAAEGTKKGFKEVFKEGIKRAGKREVRSQIANDVLTEAAQGLFSTIAVPAFMDEYGKGMNPVANMVLSMGLSMGSGIAISKGIGKLNRMRPADFDFEAHAKTKGDKGDLIDIRRNPDKLHAMQEAYLKANPHKTADDFLKDYDDLLLKQMKDAEVKAKWQKQAREDMLQYVPTEHKAQFAETPIEMMGEKAFRKLTGSKKGEAIVIIKDGKPTVIVKQGASPTALRREAPHLLQAVDEKWKAHIKMLDEGNLQNWKTKDVREKFRLYDAKLDLEIDGTKMELDFLRNAAKKANAPAGLAGEIAELEEMLRHLQKRRTEVGQIGPLRRTLMAWSRLFEPQYLEQEPRLFAKKTKGKLKTRGQTYENIELAEDWSFDAHLFRFGEPKVDANGKIVKPGLKEALDDMNAFLAQKGQKVTISLHQGGQATDYAFPRILLSGDPDAPPPYLFVREIGDKQGRKWPFRLEPNPGGYPPVPEGHYYIKGEGGTLYLGKLGDPEARGLKIRPLTKAEIESGDFHPDVKFKTEGKGRKTWPDAEFDKGAHTGANWDDFLQETYRPKGWPEGAPSRDVARSYSEFRDFVAKFLKAKGVADDAIDGHIHKTLDEVVNGLDGKKRTVANVRHEFKQRYKKQIQSWITEGLELDVDGTIPAEGIKKSLGRLKQFTESGINVKDQGNVAESWYQTLRSKQGRELHHEPVLTKGDKSKGAAVYEGKMPDFADPTDKALIDVKSHKGSLSGEDVARLEAYLKAVGDEGGAHLTHPNMDGVQGGFDKVRVVFTNADGAKASATRLQDLLDDPNFSFEVFDAKGVPHRLDKKRLAFIQKKLGVDSLDGVFKKGWPELEFEWDKPHAAVTGSLKFGTGLAGEAYPGGFAKVVKDFDDMLDALYKKHGVEWEGFELESPDLPSTRFYESERIIHFHDTERITKFTVAEEVQHAIDFALGARGEQIIAAAMKNKVFSGATDRKSLELLSDWWHRRVFTRLLKNIDAERYGLGYLKERIDEVYGFYKEIGGKKTLAEILDKDWEKEGLY